MKISIITPTFNRANMLDKLYASILINNNNSNCNIEWIIIDDGSTDSTKLIVNQYIIDGIVEVKYFYQENSGKMRAINNYIKESTGDLIIECDSDDYFANNAFKIINNAFLECKDLSTIYAMVFLKNDQNGNNMGNEFPENCIDSTMFDLYFKEGVKGEKLLVYNADIRKQFNYKLEHNEKFVTEARLHHELDLKYDVKCFNKVVMICEYKKDGYTKNINDIFKKNPYGYYEYFKEIFDQDLKGVSFRKKLYIYKHYILFSVLSRQKKSLKQVKGIFNKIMIVILYLPGLIKTKRKFKMK